MKKSLSLLLVAVILFGMSSGCSQQAGHHSFQVANEIFTYQKIDPEKTQIVVSRTGNINVQGLCRSFESQNPDIQVIYLDITGGNAGYAPLVDWIRNGYAPDIVFSAAGFIDEELTRQYFETLSGDPVVQNYETAALQRTATGNEVYWLPGPSDISAMMYNKTLFQQYGWQVPVTFDEFVSLCDLIRKDTNGDVEPWNPNAKYSDELTTALECFTYDELFAGVDNCAWYNSVMSGTGVLTGHMEPYTEVLKALIDHGILREEQFSYSATARGKEFADGKIAMINGTIYDPDSDRFDFGYMPFPTTQGSLGYLCDKYSCFVGVPVKERTDRQVSAVHRFLEYFSTPEGQAAYIEKSIKVSNLKGMALAGSADLTLLEPAVDAGHMFALMNFSDPISGQVRVRLHQIAMDMTTGGQNGKACLAAIDASLTAPAETVAPAAPEVVAVLKKDMTILDTSFFIADAYRETTGAEIGLIANNEVFRGNVMRLFKGEITADTVTVLKPRSFANDSSLIKVSMTGQQIKDALNHPVGNDRTADCIYAYSGLKCEVAPWKEPGTRYLSIRLADGSDLDPNTLYTVAIWAGTVSDQYITDTLETYEGSWEEKISAYLRASGTVVPADDGRIRLIWE